MRWYDRLRRSGEIAFVRRRGRRAALPTLSAYAVPGRPPSLIAVTVSRAVGPAVVRNLVRRRVKGALDALPAPAQAARLVFVAKPDAAGAPYERLASDVAAALERLSS